VSDRASTLDPVVAARIAELEELLATQRAALEEERARRAGIEAERDRIGLELDRIGAERDRLREAYEALTRDVELARRRLLVAKAERVDTLQLELEFAAKLAELDQKSRKAEEEIGEKPERDRKKRKPPSGRRDLSQVDLPEERVEIPDLVLEGKAKRIGSEDSIAVRWKRGGFVRLVLARIKYEPTTPAAVGDAETSTPACTREELAAIVAAEPRTAGAVVVTAPMPLRLIDRSYATPSLVAHVASDKFCDGLPLNRQEERFARLGFAIDRGTLCRWLEEAGGIVGATIVEAMRKEALGSAHCIATDATGVRVQPIPREDKQSQPCRRGHFFVQIADADHVFFEYSPDETSAVVSRLFAGYTGFVQADAKSVFDVLFRVPEERERSSEERAVACTEVGCWSHARTKNWEAAVATQSVVAREALARIMRMFHLDALWKTKLPDVRKGMRDRYLRPHVEAFFAFVEIAYAEVKKQRGMLRAALGYCVRQKAALMRFLDDGALEMTNNHSERQLRRIATGRNAWLFIGSDLHGEAAANLMTLIASARLHKLDPEVYLRDVFRVLSHWPRERYLELSPRYWRITRARLRREELDREVGELTIPDALPTMPAVDSVASSATAP
jgi:transposase